MISGVLTGLVISDINDIWGWRYHTLTGLMLPVTLMLLAIDHTYDTTLQSCILCLKWQEDTYDIYHQNNRWPFVFINMVRLRPNT